VVHRSRAAGLFVAWRYFQPCGWPAPPHPLTRPSEVGRDRTSRQRRLCDHAIPTLRLPHLVHDRRPACGNPARGVLRRQRRRCPRRPSWHRGTSKRPSAQCPKPRRQPSR
jgi:hypothetical protein